MRVRPRAWRRSVPLQGRRQAAGGCLCRASIVEQLTPGPGVEIELADRGLTSRSARNGERGTSPAQRLLQLRCLAFGHEVAQGRRERRRLEPTLAALDLVARDLSRLGQR